MTGLPRARSVTKQPNTKGSSSRDRTCGVYPSPAFTTRSAVPSRFDVPPRRSTWNTGDVLLPADVAGCGFGCTVALAICVVFWCGVAWLLWRATR